MYVINEYFLEDNNTSPQTLYLPEDAEVVSVANTSKGISLFVLADQLKTNSNLHTFEICSTYDRVYSDKVKYIGMYFSDTLGVRHVIELLQWVR